jgi:hypothetical protein
LGARTTDGLDGLSAPLARRLDGLDRPRRYRHLAGAIAMTIITDDMIERAAKVICIYQERPCPGDACRFCKKKARIALEAALNGKEE